MGWLDTHRAARKFWPILSSLKIKEASQRNLIKILVQLRVS